MYLLATRGQSIVKIHLKMKIVRYPTGEETGFYRNVFLREILFRMFLLLGMGIIHIIDVVSLFINKEHRVLHDKLAGTIVISLDDK